MTFQLRFETGSLAGTQIVTAAPSIRLGREREHNDIILSNPEASRRHALLTTGPRGSFLEVTGAGPAEINRTPVVRSGERSPMFFLSSGDRVDLGGVEFIYEQVTAKLVVVSGPAAGRSLVLMGPARVGAGGDCDLILNAPGIAARHILINVTPWGFRAEPLAAMVVNGAPSQARILTHGDEIKIAGTELRFAIESQNVESDNVEPTSNYVKSDNAVGELVFIAGLGKDQKIPLGDAQLIFGTRADCTWVMTDPLVSSVHCAVSRNGNEFVVTDLGSTNGTILNGVRINKGTTLRPGDLIALGGHVMEARLMGGVVEAARTSMKFTAMDMPAVPQPRIVIDGRVFTGGKISIGRSPQCDIVIESPLASRTHCTVQWNKDRRFEIADSSSHGTYLDDKRIVTALIGENSVLRVADMLFRISSRGEVCTIERTDALLAQAAVDVAREHAAKFTVAIQANEMAQAMASANRPPGSPPIAMQGNNVGLRTVMRIDGAALEQQIAARKKDLRKGAPVWRPSSDLSPNRMQTWAIRVSAAAALLVCLGTVFARRGEALINHPLSSAHSSVAFVEATKAKGLTVCASCHSAGNRAPSERCVACHTGFSAAAPHNKIDCGRCHHEHEGDVVSATGAAHELGGNNSCATCHPSQHKADFAPSGEVPQKLAAGILPAKHLDPEALHIAHSSVTVAGKSVGIACAACHAKASGVGAAMVEGQPGMACFRCHDGGDQALVSGCDRCHGKQHPASQVLARLPANDPGKAPAIASPSTPRSLAWAGVLGLVAALPALGIGVFMRRGRRKSDEAIVETLRAQPAEVVKRLVHSINDSKCVGCNMCVQACPASVLDLVNHKSRVINFDSCIQCKKCENACAFDALRMHDADKPPPMIPMPQIDAFHETAVAGMFLVGQASGTPQVKNATNLGRAAVQRILQQGFKPGASKALGAQVDVIIVGSGPAGLSAAVTCTEFGLSYLVLEKEREFSWTIRNYYHKGKEVMAEPHDVALTASLPHWDTSREELLSAWDKMIRETQMPIRFQSNVTDIKKDGDKFNVTLTDTNKQTSVLTAGRVVLAIGTLGNPRKLGCPGEDLDKVKNSLVDPDEWRKKNVLVVGGSDSAVEVVLALGAHNKVWFSTRGAKLEGIKPKNRQLIEAAIADGRCTMLYATAVAEVTATMAAVTYRDDNRREDIPNDVVFAMIGGNPPTKWLQQIGVPYVDKPHSWSPPRTDHLSAKTAEGLIPLRRLVANIPTKKRQH
jgi:thioredoxin reductase (NADPH)